MIVNSLINGLFVFAIGFSDGTSNYDGPVSEGYDGLAGGALMGEFFALFECVVYGVPLGYLY